MLTIRFPTGLSIRYDDANYVSRHAGGYTDLYTKKDGTWLAQVSNDCIIEARRPDRIYRAVDDPDVLFEAAVAKVREAPTYYLAKLKTALRDFDSRRRVWK